jgi:hypothetical protein
MVFQMLVWRVLRKHLQLKVYKLSIVQDVEGWIYFLDVF